MFQNITAETTEASIVASVVIARSRLAEKAAEFAAESTGESVAFSLRGEALVGLAQNVASSEALAVAKLRYLKVCKIKPENRLQTLFEMLARGADDSWSGRRNDSRRSEFDTIRDWASRQANYLEN